MPCCKDLSTLMLAVFDLIKTKERARDDYDSGLNIGVDVLTAVVGNGLGNTFYTTKPNGMGWACRSAARSSKRMADKLWGERQ
jgi:hypothetical protein